MTLIAGYDILLIATSYASEAVATSYGMATGTFGIKIDEGTSPTVG